LGLWVQAEGAIFDFYEDAEPFIIPRKKLPTAKYYEAAIDYGTNNAFTCGLFGINNETKPKIWLERVYWWDGREKNQQKTDLEYCEDLKEFFGTDIPRTIWVDPSAASFKVQAKRSGIIGIRDADNDVMNGIMTHSRMLKSGEFAICEECEHDRREYQSYVWDPKAQKRGEDKPLKENDHGMDRTRYMLHSRYGQEMIDYSKLTAW